MVATRSSVILNAQLEQSLNESVHGFPIETIVDDLVGGASRHGLPVEYVSEILGLVASTGVEKVGEI